MAYEDSVENILSLIDRGEVDKAVDVVDEAHVQYGSQNKRSVYAQYEVRHLAYWHHRSGDWKSKRASYSDSLLAADPTDGDATAEVPRALKFYGHLLRFLYREEQAIPILEALMAMECEQPQLHRIGIGAEGTWGMLAACYKSTDDSVSEDRVRKIVGEQNEFHRNYASQHSQEIRATALEEQEQFKKARQTGAYKPMPEELSEPHSSAVRDELPASQETDRRWWKFW